VNDVTSPYVPEPDDVASPAAVADALGRDGYLADEELATALFLAVRLGRPLLLEGEAGVGKTEVARAWASVTGSPLIRLQCYEGIDIGHALYEWDYPRQLLHLRSAEAGGTGRPADALEAELYDERFLIRRPLLEALGGEVGSPAPVLLIDEIDRADDEFEAFLLEVLSDHAVTIPELGTITAAVVPIEVLTSNRTRDLHDPLKRRCIYHWVDHPDAEREAAIVASRAPGLPAELVARTVGLVVELRALSLYKPPGVAETIDWAHAFGELGAGVDATTTRLTLGAVLKYHEDRERILDAGIERLLEPDEPGS